MVDPLILWRMTRSNLNNKPKIIPDAPNKAGRTIIAPNAIAVPALRPIVKRSMINPPTAYINPSTNPPTKSHFVNALLFKNNLSRLVFVSTGLVVIFSLVDLAYCCELLSNCKCFKSCFSSNRQGIS